MLRDFRTSARVAGLSEEDSGGPSRHSGGGVRVEAFVWRRRVSEVHHEFGRGLVFLSAFDFFC